MLGFGAAHLAVNLHLRAAWTGMLALALGMWSVVLGPAAPAVHGRVSCRRVVLSGYQRDAPESARVHGLHNGELEAHLRARGWTLHHASLAAAQPHDTWLLRFGRSFPAVAGKDEFGCPAPPRRSDRCYCGGVRTSRRHLRGRSPHRPRSPVASRVAHPAARLDNHRLDGVGGTGLRGGALEGTPDRTRRDQSPPASARRASHGRRGAVLRGEGRGPLPQFRGCEDLQLRPRSDLPLDQGQHRETAACCSRATARTTPSPLTRPC